MKKFLFILGAILILLFIAIFVFSNKENPSNEQTPITNIEMSELKGVSLSPSSYSQEDFTNFFTKATEANDAITGWAEIAEFENENSLPYVVAGLSKQYDYEPVIFVGLKETSTALQYKESLMNFLNENKINYLGLGVEVNRYENFDEYAQVYNELYNEIKTASPNTDIFPIFQYEQMKGLQGGLFGKENNVENSEWDLIDELQFDMLGFTTYPGLIYKNPADIPENYYTEISQHTNKPIAFTEIGWFREFDVKGWESSEQEQAEFVNRYFELTENVDVKLNIWLHLYDQSSEEPFATMGLLEKGEETSLAFEAWKAQ